MNQESGKLPPPTCLHPEVRYDAEKDNYYCQSCHGGMGLAYYKVARERDSLKAERQGWIGFTENWVKDPNSTMPTTREDWSKWMAGWNALKLDTVKQANQISVLKSTLTNLLNAATILHGQSPDSTAKAMVGAELDLAEKALK